MASSPRTTAAAGLALLLVLLALGATASAGLSASPQAAFSTPLVDDLPDASAVPGADATPALPDASLLPAASGQPQSALLASLLQATDLPSTLTSQGLATDDAGLDIDLAAFYANDGVSLATQLWQSPDALPVAAVFDFRMQFATPEAAAAYLVAAGPTLSEQQSAGLQPVPGAPAIGEDSSTYSVVTPQDEQAITVYDFLFRVGPVAAKVFVAGYGTTAEQATAIAAAAAQRMTQVGPPPPGTPAPPPSPTPTPGPGDSGLSADELLAAHVPADILSTCQSDPRRFYEGETASLLCYPVSDMYAAYTQYDTPEHMTAAFQDSTADLDLGDGSGSCETNPYIGIYTVDGTDAGTVACWLDEAITNILWTDDATGILSFGSSDTLNLAGLYAWWLGAGPAH